MPPIIVDSRELARRLDRSYADVTRWARRGLIPSTKCGGRYFFDVEHVIRALHEQSRPRVGEPVAS